VDKALRLLRKELGDETALIGFAGSPWTLATFMMEGGSAEKYTRALDLFHKDRRNYNALAEKLTAAVTAYLQMQINAGVDALQIFDSHGGLLAPTDFQEASGRWMREIITNLRKTTDLRLPTNRREIPPLPGGEGRGEGKRDVKIIAAPELAIPVIVFSLGTHGNWDDLINTGASVLGIDWQFPLADARQLLPSTVGLQGNLAPALLSDATPDAVAAETRRLLEEMRGRRGYIFNLGHGVPPTAKLENMAKVVETVRGFV
jgi:uroporphyrinogen decarboxylase